MSAAADTSTVGSFSVPVTGRDNAGRTTTVQCPYRVLSAPRSVTVSNVSLLEGNTGTSNAAFTVWLSAAPTTGTVSVKVATADGSATAGSDYTTLPNAVVADAQATGTIVNDD